MKQFAAAFMLSLVLVSTPGFAQLSKVPALVQHYHAHQEETHSISVVQFLAEHYFDHHHTGSPSDDHTKLPFKQASTHEFSANSIALSNTAAIVKAPVYFLDCGKKLFSVSYIRTSFTANIWQPPRA